MNEFHPLQALSIECVEQVVRGIFPERDTRVERVLSGISTYVYRITAQGQTYYLRIVPDEHSTFAPEIAALTRLQEKDLRVPRLVYAEQYNSIVKRSLMIETEIKGQALSKSTLPLESFQAVVREAGRELARINSIPTEGFGWILADPTRPGRLNAQWSGFRAFALAYREADLAYLRQEVLKGQTMTQLEYVLKSYDEWLDIEQGYLAHGDFDSTHVFQEKGKFSGIIDFGEVRGTNFWYDLAHYRIRDGAFPPYKLFAELERGYAEVQNLPEEYEQRLRFTSIIINIRALARAFQTRPPDEYIWRQIETLHNDLLVLCAYR